MRSSHKSLGDYIEQVKTRNVGGRYDKLRGVSIDKFFMPSVANIYGVDLSKYKVVKPGQFAFNPMHVGRDKVLPISLLSGEESVIVSPAYTVFRISDEALLPEYLMMWCSRTEFDRNAWFKTDGNVRGGLSWEDFCEITLPVPDRTEQQRIISEHKSIISRAKLNEQLVNLLENAAQAIHKHWFEDFEFPMSTSYAKSIGKPELAGKPYKSNGGQMTEVAVFSSPIPAQWSAHRMEEVIEVKDGTHDSPPPCTDGYPLVTSAHLRRYDVAIDGTYNISENDFHEVNKRSKVDTGDILFSMIGTVGSISYVLDDKARFAIKNVGLFKTSSKPHLANYLFFWLRSSFVNDYIRESLAGSTQSYMTLTSLRDIPVLIPSKEILEAFDEYMQVIINNISNSTTENTKNNELIKILHGKMAASLL